MRSGTLVLAFLGLFFASVSALNLAGIWEAVTREPSNFTLGIVSIFPSLFFFAVAFYLKRKDQRAS
jgi:hypothetical protein